MAEQGALARGQQGGQELPFLGEQFWRHRRVHARVDAVQPAERSARSIAELLTPAASSCARATIPSCSARDRANRSG